MHCLICQTAVPSNVLTIWGAAICSDCEARLVEVTVEEREYKIIAQALRCLWERHYFSQPGHHLLETDGM